MTAPERNACVGAKFRRWNGDLIEVINTDVRSNGHPLPHLVRVEITKPSGYARRSYFGRRYLETSDKYEVVPR